MEKLVGNDSVLPSSLERQRIRDIRVFRQKIKDLQLQIQEVRDSGRVTSLDQEKSFKLFQDLKFEESDPEIKKAIQLID